MVLRMAKSRPQHQAASIWASSGDWIDAPVVVLRLALRSPARGHCTVLLMLTTLGGLVSYLGLLLAANVKPLVSQGTQKELASVSERF